MLTTYQLSLLLIQSYSRHCAPNKCIIVIVIIIM